MSGVGGLRICKREKECLGWFCKGWHSNQMKVDFALVKRMVLPGEPGVYYMGVTAFV